MSKPSAVFSNTPLKNVKSSPSKNKTNSARTVRNSPLTPGITNASPRKCRIQTEIQSSPSWGMQGAIVNVKSKLQIDCESTPKNNKGSNMTKQSSRQEQQSNEIKNKTLTPRNKTDNTTARSNNGMNLREKQGSTTKPSSFRSDSRKADLPASTIVKSMRSCFEHKGLPSKPPPSPTPSRAKFHLAELTTPKNNNSAGIKGILSSRSKYNYSPSFRVPSGSNTSTPRPAKLRRSVSAGSLTKPVCSQGESNLARSSSQTITPKHRVKFEDEATPECFSPVLLESKSDHGSGDSIAGEVTNLTVAVRVRPLFSGERNVVSVDNNSIKVKALGSEHCFPYEFCFDSTHTQQHVFNTMVKPLVDVAFQGYNVCLFAYGQTGTGKTYSMMGEEIASVNVPENAGIIPRFTHELFRIIESCEEYSHTKVEISYFEIYNEKIRDLLGPSQNGRSAPLRVREHPELGPYVVDLTVHNVHSFETLQDWLNVGNNHRETAATEMNMNSSRSHSIFTVTLTQSQADDRPSLCSKINLIDLAGSERLAQTCSSADKLKESVSINRSLLTLGKVISSLAEKKKRGFIPYRESVLTWLLRESLGGNSRTAMLATISPSMQYVEETLSTLRYACQARNIVNTVRINESPHEKRVRELMEEVQKLKEGINMKDHDECIKKQKSLEAQLNEAREDLSRANILFSKSEMEIEKLINELAEIREMNSHAECDKKISDLEKDLSECSKLVLKYEKDMAGLKHNMSHFDDENFKYLEQITYLEQKIEDINKSNHGSKEKVSNLTAELEKLEQLSRKQQAEVDNLNKELEDSMMKNRIYEKDLSEMRNNMVEIKNNSSHDHCDSQILMLKTALSETERSNATYEEEIRMLKRKCSEAAKKSNHDGCEKEIIALKCTISELKISNDHKKCDGVVEKLKTALTEAEKLVIELETELEKVKEEKLVLEKEAVENRKEIYLLKSEVKEAKNQNNHLECELRIKTLKRALDVSKSINTHVECENRISDLENELQNINSSSKLSTFKGGEDMVLLETQMRCLKEENSRIKKKKVEDENKISSLEEQVTSLTKELLDVKSQLRIAVRDKESSASLCTQLQEQLLQQDRKLAVTQSRKQLFGDDDKENWETPTKVIRRSIARYSNTKNNTDRCSLVTRAEEIHQAVKDAEDICTRLKIPWTFRLEPEVTTHSWFDVNVRVWDQRTTHSVRWPQEVFLGWLKEMKDVIMSQSRGPKLFQKASWVQKTTLTEAEPLVTKSDNLKENRNLQEEVEKLRNKVMVLESLSEAHKKEEVISALSDLSSSVANLQNKLSLSSAHSTVISLRTTKTH